MMSNFDELVKSNKLRKTISPATNQLFCLPLKEDEKTESGIYISNIPRMASSMAKVINVGPIVSIRNSYKCGDVILYKSYAGTELKIDMEIFVMLNVDDVLGTVLEVEG